MADTPRTRVIVAVGSICPNPLALAAAAELAMAVDAELATLFIEDISLLRLAELPIALEVGITLPAPRRLLATDIECGFKSQAGELRRVLAEIGAALEIDLTFDVARGKPARVLLETSTAQDLIVFATAVPGTLTHHPPAQVVRKALHSATGAKAQRPGRTVAALVRPDDTLPRILTVASKLALRSEAELVLLVEDAARDDGLAEAVNAWLESQEATARIVRLPDMSPATIAARVAEMNSQVLFLPGDGAPAIECAIETLLAKIHCPVVVVR